MTKVFSEDKFMTTIKIGPKGQVIIPKEVRDMFGFNSGDKVLLMADKEKGVAIVPFNAELWELVSSNKDKKN